MGANQDRLDANLDRMLAELQNAVATGRWPDPPAEHRDLAGRLADALPIRTAHLRAVFIPRGELLYDEVMEFLKWCRDAGIDRIRFNRPRSKDVSQPMERRSQAYIRGMLQ